MTESDLILSHLKFLFLELMQAVSDGNKVQKKKMGFNAKGDQVRWFDIVADQTACDYLNERFPYPVRLLSEEGNLRSFGKGKPEFTMVIDPVDGSDNFYRGIPIAGMSVALIPADLPISVSTVEYSLVGDLFTGKILTAARGRGAYNEGNPVYTSKITNLEKALISCELNHFRMNLPLTHILLHARGVRTFGCAIRALSMVATGILDAHLDLRCRLTPENFIGPSLIISEAGGILTDPQGKPLPDIQDLTERHSILASATPQLHEVLIQQIKGKEASEQ